MRVFLDANVLFSASNNISNIARLVDWLITDGTAVASDLAIEEARRDLALKRAGWLPAFELLLERIEIVPSAQFELPVPLDDRDRPLLCAAVRSGCHFYATGDRRDFGHLFNTTIEGVQAISLLRLAELLAERSKPGT